MPIATYYRPTQRRGKRVVYKSIDPAESKTPTAEIIFVGIAIVIILFVGVFVSNSN